MLIGSYKTITFIETIPSAFKPLVCFLWHQQIGNVCCLRDVNRVMIIKSFYFQNKRSSWLYRNIYINEGQLNATKLCVLWIISEFVAFSGDLWAPANWCWNAFISQWDLICLWGEDPAASLHLNVEKHFNTQHNLNTNYFAHKPIAFTFTPDVSHVACCRDKWVCPNYWKRDLFIQMSQACFLTLSLWSLCVCVYVCVMFILMTETKTGITKRVSDQVLIMFLIGWRSMCCSVDLISVSRL